MSIDRFYVQCDGRWNKLGEAELSNVHRDFWVDVFHGANILINERYYFFSLADAQEFYREGWKERQYLDDTDQPCGLDHIELYAHGELVQHR